MNVLLGLVVRILAAVNAPLTRLGRNAAAVLVALMVLFAIAQILSRGLFSYSLDWAEEFARFALVWSVLLVAPFAYRRGAHIAIGAFSEALPQWLRLLLSMALNLLVGWICLRFLLEGIEFWRRGLTLQATTVPLSMAWVYAIVPATFSLLLSVALELVARLAQAVGARGEVSGLVMAGSVAATDD